MPEYFPFTTSRSSAPKVVVSRPAEESTGRPRRDPHSRNQSGYLSTSKAYPRPPSYPSSSSWASSKDEQQEQSSNEWEDVDETRLRNRRRRRRSPSARSDHRHRTTFKSTPQQNPYRGEVTRLERSGYHGSALSLLSEATSQSSDRRSTSSSKASVYRSYGERDSTRRRDQRVKSSPLSSSRYSRVGSGLFSTAGLQTMTTMNPSTLSVLTTGTKSTDRSSGSGSTVTQTTYRRRDSQSSRHSDESHQLRRRSGSANGMAFLDRSDNPRPTDPSFPDSKAITEDDASDSSSSGSSEDEASNADSSGGADTPSSRSTVPSPTATRSHSTSDPKRKRKPELQQVPAGYVVKRHSSIGSESTGGRSSIKAPEVDDIREDDENVSNGDSDTEAAATGEVEEDSLSRHSDSTSRSSSAPQQRVFTDQLWRQEEAMRQHLARAQHQNQHQQHTHPDAAFFERRPSPYQNPSQSPSPGLTYPDAQAYAPFPPPHNQLQPYEWPHNQAPPPSQQAIDQANSFLQRYEPNTPHAGPPQAISQPHQQQAPAMQHQQQGNSEPQSPSSNAPPTAPEAPDLSHRTTEGYEKLALELADRSSPVKPLYRRFAYLQHRILLHLQDELCELEEQLGVLDECIARSGMPAFYHSRSSNGAALHRSTSSSSDAEEERGENEPISPLPPPPRARPISRRAELTHGSEMHFQRTQLLGRIFVKSEQYSRAVAAFAALSAGSASGEGNDCGADPGDLKVYQEWIRSHAPLHESETRFLLAGEDLFEPGAPGAAGAASAKIDSSISAKGGSLPTATTAQRNQDISPSSSRQMFLAVGLPVILLLSLLLFALIPSLLGRFVVIAGFALSAWAVAVASPRLRELLPDDNRDFIACASGLGFVLAVLAAWVL